MTASPLEGNRLDQEASPYLRQHADNPVNWQPWDETARAAAREHDRPIFLSIGYAACHWCHVMEEESFADETVAKRLNESFVPVKVDREERPDLDRIYQTICQLVSGRGGWPLSVWLTPEGEPFYVGTYFPRDAKRGMPGFLDVLDSLEERWEHERSKVQSRAEQWTAQLKQSLESVPGDGAGSSDETTLSTPTLGDEEQPARADQLLEAAKLESIEAADREHGGFGSNGPKFPQPARIELLLTAAERFDETEALTVATESLDAMATGGLYDHLGGGFHRYATDREWIVPHFEKMLYDNAELPRVYCAGYRATGEETYARVVRETLRFVERELTHPQGGVYSTLNAQSPVPPERTDRDHEPSDRDRVDDRSAAGDEEEGAFYVWTPQEVEAALDDELVELFCDRFGVTEDGNFEGSTVLAVEASVAELATEHGFEEETVRDRLERATEQAFEARERRPRPSRDEKIIGAWNGLFVGAVAEASLCFDNVDPAQATAALSFGRQQLWDGDRLARRYKDGDVAGIGYLEEYAFLGRGALRCYEATGDVEHLAFALDLARVVEDRFWTESDGTLYFTPVDGEELIARPQEPTDQSTPSSLGVATELLISLDPFVPHDRFVEIAGTVLETYAPAMESSPLQHTTLVGCASRLVTGPLEITIAADELPEQWRSWAGQLQHSGRLLARRPPTGDGLEEWLDRLGLSEAPPIWAGRERREDDQVTAFVCRDRACSPPLTSVSEAREWLEN
jgi:uncharacterized protein YyaL (SSP411 family)